MVNPPNPYHALLRRNVVHSLDGRWRFKADPADEGEAQRWYSAGVADRICPVPAAWQFVFEELRDYKGPVWYQRELTVSSKHKDKRVAVVFCGVDHYATIWVNGQLGGKHEGGYLPFSVDISGLISFDQPNTLTVKAVVPHDQLEIPGDETGEGHRAGIWRPVWMEVTGATHISDIYVAPDIDGSMARVQVEITSPQFEKERPLRLSLRADGPDGKAYTVEEGVVLPANDKPFSIEIQSAIPIADAILWTLESPQLYRLTAAIMDREQTLDAASVEFGMRKIDIDGIHIRLNNKPIYLFGAMDAQDIPDKNIYLPAYHAPTDEEIKNEVVLAKKMGFNCIRKHFQIEDARYLKWADRLGILVYGQPPCYRRITDAAIHRWRCLLEGWVRRDRNHPSMMMWTLFNAAQGLQPMPTAYDKRAENESESRTPEEVAEMVKVAHDLVKRLDPTRPVMDTAGGEFFNSEVNSLMRYGFTGPQYYRRSRAHYPALTAARVTRTPGAPLPPPNPNPKPLIVGELGGYIYFPDMEKFKEQWGGKTPWPIVRSAGLGWGELGEKMAAGYTERFYDWGLDKVYGSFPQFAERHDWAAFHDLKDEVEQVRKSPDVTGYLFTMFSNIGPYVHGLLDYDMSLRPFYQDLAKLNNPDLIIIDWEELNFWSGDAFQANLVLSHYGDNEISECVAKWQLEGFDVRGETTGISMDAVGVETVGRISFQTPVVEQSIKARLVVELHGGGEKSSENYVDLYLYPASKVRPTERRKVNVYGVAEDNLVDAGYETHAGIHPDIPVAVSTVFDARVDGYLSGGGTVLLFVGDGAKIQPGLGVSIGEVGYALGTMPGCNFWGYINPEKGLFKTIPSENPMGWTFLKVLASPPGQDMISGGTGGSPTLSKMIAGLDASAKADILIGCYSEWLRSRSADGSSLQGAVPKEVAGLIVQFRYKNGRVIISTLDLLGALAVDPVATIMFHELIDYCFTDFTPKSLLPIR